MNCDSLLQHSSPAWLKLFVDHTHTHSVNNLRWQPHDSPDWRHFRESHVTDGEPETAVSASLQKIKSIKNQHKPLLFSFFYFIKSQISDSFVNHLDGHFAYLKTLDFFFKSFFFFFFFFFALACERIFIKVFVKFHWKQICYRTGKYSVCRSVPASFSSEILHAWAVKGLMS